MTSTATDDKVTTTQVYRVYIKATPQAVWDAITQPDWTEKYLYGARVSFDLRPGGAYEARWTEEVKREAAAKGFPPPETITDGEVLEVDPPHKLVQTWRLNMPAEAAAEGFTRLTWEIQESDGGVTRLTVIHDVAGAPTVAALVSGAWESEGAGGGWAGILSGLKTLLETGEVLWR